ncbi:MAG: tetratricopeptide repeat protein [Rhodothalassiaceae bacterium]
MFLVVIGLSQCASGVAEAQDGETGPVSRIELAIPDPLLDAGRALNRRRPAQAWKRLEAAETGNYSPRFVVLGLHYRCVALLQLRDYERALGFCVDAADRQPQFFRHKNNLAAAYIGLQDYERAIDLLEQALARHGPRPELKANLRLARQLLKNDRYPGRPRLREDEPPPPRTSVGA